MTLLDAGASDGRGPPTPGSPWSAVPWRTIVASVLVVACFGAALVLVVATRRILLWVVIAGFAAIVLAPSVRRVQARLGGHRGPVLPG